ncbi:radical SAM family heme chaperone HemW [Nereida sp. MMG025]|uniref:radical SAM family heme chaperone HemW n=1 Tax=Nereida sp. MMG025 TaxID=2909981 RepID=UPI001F024093|nr:radical SAM family heme chaperone HemW [Nereida sp. MMG025]MCF6444618.1 radical SAM family heme chaperone HemW [Nereida sp. MMG025]
MQDDWQNAGFGLYIHWPFCSAKCPYCDFNSYVADHIDEDRWVRAYIREIERIASQTSDRILKSVFFGGGTPSLMSENAVGAILEAVGKNWRFTNDIEITLEANPTSVEASRFEGYRAAGVNRVSLGIQALNDPDLKRLGRLHSVAEGLAALEIAKKTFERTSFDLIYSRQDQTLADWETELRVALDLAGDHLSMYQLTIEPNTAFGDRYKAGKLKGLPSEDAEADMYFRTQELCADRGLCSYEVSNFAQKGAESRHNLIYWRYGDYAGIGPGAHGRLTLGGHRFATETELSPMGWLTKVEKNGSGEVARSSLSKQEQGTEFLLMGLRLAEGVSLDRYSHLTGSAISPSVIENLSELGMVRLENGILQVSEKGRPLINAILRDLLADQ